MNTIEQQYNHIRGLFRGKDIPRGKRKYKFNIYEKKGRVYCVVYVKKRFFYRKYYIKFLGLLRGQAHSPFYMERNKKEFVLNCRLDSDFVKDCYKRVMLFFLRGGRPGFLINDIQYIDLVGFDGEPIK